MGADSCNCKIFLELGPGITVFILGATSRLNSSNFILVTIISEVLKY